MPFSSVAEILPVCKASLQVLLEAMQTHLQTHVLEVMATSSLKTLLLPHKLLFPIPSKGLLIQEFLLLLFSAIPEQLFLISIFCPPINTRISTASIPFFLPLDVMPVIFTSLRIQAASAPARSILFQTME